MTSQCIRRHTGLEYSIEMVYRTEYSLVIAIRILVQMADQYGRLQQSESRLGGVEAVAGSFVVGREIQGLTICCLVVAVHCPASCCLSLYNTKAYKHKRPAADVVSSASLC
jgi:hypothetical protein